MIPIFWCYVTVGKSKDVTQIYPNFYDANLISILLERERDRERETERERERGGRGGKEQTETKAVSLSLARFKTMMRNR